MVLLALDKRKDFRWEEYYIFGPGDANEYGRLQKNQPSYQDIFELLAIEKDVFSEWMMFQGEDLAALLVKATIQNFLDELISELGKGR